MKVNIEEEMKSSYIDYSMSVIVARALPDVRDGFKPVHRRILYGMLGLGNTSDKPYKKCARVVGDVLGKYHPHGDSSVYGALVRMGQEWNMRYKLVDGQGNFGSVDGDSPAAMRYTECRLSKMGEHIMDDIDKDTVDMVNNFDDTLKEPAVMPTMIPNLLVNGGNGIAVGMATNIPTHNLGEVIDGCCAYIDNPDIDIEGLMSYIPAPDFPTGAYIYGLDGVRSAYETGRGRIIMRAKAELGWETQIQTNFGVRATFFTKLTVDLNIYHRKTKDMLQSVPIPTTTGFSSQAINIGSMSNRGVEVEVDYNILRTRDYFLTVGVNYAFNRNRIDELFYGFKEWEMKEYLLNYVVGKSLNFYMPIYAGVDKEDGRPMWYKVGHKGGIQHEYNPETMTKDESQIDNLYQDTGKAQEAPHTGGFNIQAGWKGLTLSANFSYVLGKYMIDNEYLWNTGKSNLTSNKGQAHRDMLNIWKQPGDIATLPAFEYQSLL